MKLIFITLFYLISNPVFSQTNNLESESNWKLVFEDEFNTNGSFDTTKWTYASRLQSAWAKFLTEGSDYVNQSNGNLVLRLDDKQIDGDPLPYHSGGIQTAGKFSFTYGKVEVRAKFNKGKGSWPAIWMMPESSSEFGAWPKSGEIDIMEHLNYEDVIHQTVHTAGGTNAKGASASTHQAKYNVDDYNLYSVIWTRENIQFLVNGVVTYTYAKAENANFEQWPFDKAFYIILNQSGGAGWSGAIENKNELPFEMQIDYVRVYQWK